MQTDPEKAPSESTNKVVLIQPERVLVTLPEELANGDTCLFLLRTILHQTSNTALLTRLRKVAWVLSREDLIEANKILSKEHASSKMLEELKNYAAKGQIPLLFNREALKLIDILLRFSPLTSILKNPVQEAYGCESIQVGALKLDSEQLWETLQTFEGIFLLSNTLVSIIQDSEPALANGEDAGGIRRFYQRYSPDGAAAVARAEIYHHPEFRSRFLQAFNLDLDAFLDTVFSLLAHYLSNPTANLSVQGEFRGFSPSQKEFFKTQLARLATPIGTLTPQMDLRSLTELSITDSERLQRPFVCIEGRYFCFDNALLYNAFSELPYYLLLDACGGEDSEVKFLGKLFGDQMEEFYRNSIASALGQHAVEDYLSTTPHKELDLKETGHRVGDILIKLPENTRLIVETKGAAPTHPIKLGSLSALQKSFLCKPNERKGVGQIVRDIQVFRRETRYDGKFFSILLFRGPIPCVAMLDKLVKAFLDGSADYQSHRRDTNNCPIIWLDRDTFELLLSGFSQGVSPAGILQELSMAPPSHARRIIWETLLQVNVRPSMAPLFDEKIQKQVSRSRSFFECEQRSF